MDTMYELAMDWEERPTFLEEMKTLKIMEELLFFVNNYNPSDNSTEDGKLLKLVSKISSEHGSAMEYMMEQVGTEKLTELPGKIINSIIKIIKGIIDKILGFFGKGSKNKAKKIKKAQDDFWKKNRSDIEKLSNEITEDLIDKHFHHIPTVNCLNGIRIFATEFFEITEEYSTDEYLQDKMDNSKLNVNTVEIDFDNIMYDVVKDAIEEVEDNDCYIFTNAKNGTAPFTMNLAYYPEAVDSKKDYFREVIKFLDDDGDYIIKCTKIYDEISDEAKFIDGELKKLEKESKSGTLVTLDDVKLQWFRLYLKSINSVGTITYNALDRYNAYIGKLKLMVDEKDK